MIFHKNGMRRSFSGILPLSNSGQSHFHFGTKFFFVGACVAKIRLNFAGKSKKFIFLPNSLGLTSKRAVFLTLKVLGKF